jgi:hypothetical protein
MPRVCFVPCACVCEYASTPSARRPLGSTGVFSSDEYRQWLSRAPSTSAIYERLRQSREALEAQRGVRFTYSAENLADKTRVSTQKFPHEGYIYFVQGWGADLLIVSSLLNCFEFRREMEFRLATNAGVGKS